MRYLDVCAGISAPTVAWKPLGWQAVCYAEIADAPRAVLAHHYPDVPLVGDFTEIKGDEYGPVDLLVGGTPCQSFSVAGLRGGLADDRGNLALEYLRLADRTRPRWLVWENVPGVLSSNGGRDFGSILGGMGELGYGVTYRVLDAQYFGCAASRARVFVVGHRGDWRAASAVLFERSCLAAVRAPRLPRENTHGTLTTGSGTKRNFDGSCTLIRDGGGVRVATVLEWERMLGFPDHYTDPNKESPFAQGQTGAESVDPLWDDAGGLRCAAIEAGERMRIMQRPDDATGCGPLPSDGPGAGHLVPPVQHQASSGRGHGLGNAGLGISGGRRGLADGPRYKCLGNSMAVPVVRWIGERIAAVEALSQRLAA